MQPTFSGLNAPFAMNVLPYPGSATKLVVVEKRGQLLTFTNGATVSGTQTLLDIRTGKNIYTAGPCGLYNVAFHPQFGQPGSANRGYFYVLYKTQPTASGENAYWRLSRFTLADGATTANPNTELILIQQFDRDQSHDPGQIFFGPDGFLYFGCGDEGDANDSHNNGQRLDHRLFSGIFRIDVDMDAARSHPIRRQPEQVAMPAGWPDSFTQNYFIPNDNPFVDPTGATLEEFFAFGLRNPYRFTHDPASGAWLTTDVGQNLREEVNVLIAGGNYGWPFREGLLAGPKPPPTTIRGTLTEPVWTYGVELGACIIGGPIYRGSEHPSLLGKLLVVDNVSGRIWANGTSGAPVEQLTNMPSGSVYSGTASIGTDAQGEPYFLKINGTSNPTVFYKLVRTGTVNPEPPALLSQTGAFSNLATLTPATGIIPFAVNSPLWSDAAHKFRWFALPNDGTHDTATEKIAFSPSAPWRFPAGTVFIKHFELPIDDTNPDVVRRLETRFVIMSATGEPYGVTYKWRADGSDADLLTTGAAEPITIATSGGGTRQQTWAYPSRTDCMTCHNSNAGHVLGVSTHQLNGDAFYSRTGRTAHQLETLASLGMFDSAYRPEHRHLFLKSAHILDPAAPLETRVRSYLDANCAQCHRPNGVEAHFDARFTTPLAQQRLIHGTLHTASTGEPEAVIKPGDLAHSIAHLRANRIGAGQMPPLAKNVVDTAAMSVVQQWIASLAAGPGVALAAPAGASGEFDVSIAFTAPVSGLTAGDFQVSRGSVVSLSGSGAAYTLRIAPLPYSEVKITLPAGAAHAAGLPNYASATARVATSAPGMVAWFKLDELAGTIAADSSPAGHNGIVSGASADDWTPGFFAGALRFGTTGARITLPQLLTGDFTVSFWIKTTQLFPQTDTPSSGAPLFHADASGTAADWVISGTRTSSTGPNRISFQTGHANGTTPNAVVHATAHIVPDQWMHVAVTRIRGTTGAPGQMTIHINGTAQGTAPGSPDLLNAQPELVIGTNPRNTAQSFAGTLDQIRLFTRALDAAEIAQLADDSGSAAPFDHWLALTLPGLTHLHDATLDPDADSRPLFAEWAFAGEALAGNDPAPVVVALGSGDALTVSIRARDQRSGLGYRLLVSEDLATWTDAGSAWTNLRFTPTPGTDHGWLTGDYTPAAPKTFFRAEASDAP